MEQPFTDCSETRNVNIRQRKTSKNRFQTERSVKFYCAGAIRGQLFYKGYFDKIVEIVKDYGEPLTEKKLYDIYPIGRYADSEEQKFQEKLVAERDKEMIRISRAVIAEFSGASTGTGWEICYATRIHRKPTLCLYDANSNPSLIIKQDNCKYTIVQAYTNELEFETYVRCFLETVTRLEGIDDIRKNYFKSIKIAKLNPNKDQIRKFVESIIEQAAKETNVEFTDAEQFIQFLFRNIILQKRWDCLKSQEIGSTFVSGEKPRIIKILSRVEGPIGIYELYDREEEDKIKYTREAFTKNLRAFRRIGLLQAITTKSPYVRGTKFKDQVIFVKTIDSGDLQLISSRSPPKKVRNLISGTQHLQQLAKFISRFTAESLVDFLRRSKNKKWYSEIPDILISNVDEIDINKFLAYEWARKIVDELHLECRSLWKEIYSSFK